MKIVKILPALLIMSVALSIAGLAAAQQTPIRKQEVKIFLPKPKIQFDIHLPVPEALIQIVNQVQGDVGPGLCPAPARNEPVCSISSTNASQLNNAFYLTWRCDGALRPCGLFLNGQPAGSVRGTGTAHLTLTSILATYELKDRNDRSCSATTVQGYRGASATPANTSTLTLSGYRWLTNTDSVTPGAALAALNSVPSVAQSSNHRVRMLVHVGEAAMPVGTRTFKLQVATKGTSCAASSFADMATSGDGFRYLNNATPADGAAIAAVAADPTHGSDTAVPQTYEEQNNFTSTVAVLEGQDAMWDFATFGNVVGTFCLRVVESDGSTFDSYSQYPEITVTGGY